MRFFVLGLVLLALILALPAGPLGFLWNVHWAVTALVALVYLAGAIIVLRLLVKGGGEPAVPPEPKRPYQDHE